MLLPVRHMLVAQRCLADLRVAIFSHVQKLPMSYFDRNPVGRLVTRMTTDVDVLQEMFASGVITLASDFVMNLPPQRCGARPSKSKALAPRPCKVRSVGNGPSRAG